MNTSKDYRFTFRPVIASQQPLIHTNYIALNTYINKRELRHNPSEKYNA